MKNIRPPIKLDHLKKLTDDTGILQHTKYSVPNRKEGYTTDDNARALVACTKLLQTKENSNANQLTQIYLSFLFHMQRADGKFHNLLGYDRKFLDIVGSEECTGRSLWACGYIMLTNPSESIKTTAKEIFDKGCRHALGFKSPRAKAFTILGLSYYYKAFPHDHNLHKNITLLADQLLTIYRQVSAPRWCWFEPYLTYANARLSQAFFEVYSVTENEKYLEIARESFDFLVEVQIIDDKFVPVGNKGWYKRGGQRAFYDQQPIEASCMVESAMTAFRVTNKEKYKSVAQIAFDWYLGRNTQNLMVYDGTTGACYDGITPEGLNLNQGAEAAISYILAALNLKDNMTD